MIGLVYTLLFVTKKVRDMQTKTGSTIETIAQVTTDVLINLFLAATAYWVFNIKVEPIATIFFIGLALNFIKSYLVRRWFTNR